MQIVGGQDHRWRVKVVQDWLDNHKRGLAITKISSHIVYTFKIVSKMYKQCANNVHHYMGYFTHS